RSYMIAQRPEHPGSKNIPARPICSQAWSAGTGREHDKDVMQMNGSWQSASEWVQCAPPNVSTMIEGSARGRRLKIPSRGDTTMLKTISAAFLAASVIAAPAIAAEAGKSTTQAPKSATQAPVIKADQTQTKASTTAVKPDVKAETKSDAKPKAMNANAAVTPS